jgi:hypothetical protein
MNMNIGYSLRGDVAAPLAEKVPWLSWTWTCFILLFSLKLGSIVFLNGARLST